MANEPDEVNSGALATIIVLLFVATLAVALVVTALVRDETARLHAQGDEAQSRAFKNLKSEQLTKLRATATWVDREQGIVKVPVTSAKEMVLAAIAANPLALSPGNPPKEEEEEDEATAALAETEAGVDPGLAEAPATQEKLKAAPQGSEKRAPAPGAAQPGTPAAPKPAAPAVAPKPTAPVTPAPVAPAPAPGGPAQ
jgi:hypothetical protein